MKKKEDGLYKYNKRSGMWNHQRSVTPETKDQWLSQFKKDEPEEHFIVSKNTPKHNPLKEDAPVNSAGGGEIAAIGVSPPSKPANWGEPGLNPKQMKKHKKDAVMRRDPPQALQETKTGVFAGNPTFIVPSDMFHKARMQKKKGKHWKTYIGEDEHGQAIRDFDRKHKGKKPIILQDENTGAMCYARYGSK